MGGWLFVVFSFYFVPVFSLRASNNWKRIWFLFWYKSTNNNKQRVLKYFVLKVGTAKNIYLDLTSIFHLESFVNIGLSTEVRIIIEWILISLFVVHIVLIALVISAFFVIFLYLCCVFFFISLCRLKMLPNLCTCCPALCRSIILMGI